MKTLLVLAPHPDLAEAVRAALNPERYRFIHRISLEEAEPILTRGMVTRIRMSNPPTQGICARVVAPSPHCPVITTPP
jgi:hypothetical protein